MKDYDIGIGGGHKYLLSLNEFNALHNPKNCPRLQHLQGSRMSREFGREIPIALARLMRFGGRSFVSVLEHSILVSAFFDFEPAPVEHYINDPTAYLNHTNPINKDKYEQIFALFHDFHEVLLGDIAGPFGQHIANHTIFGGMHFNEWKKTFFDIPMIECFLRSLYFTDQEKGPERQFEEWEINAFMTVIIERISDYDIMKRMKKADVLARDFELKLNFEINKMVKPPKFFINRFYHEIECRLKNLMLQMNEDFTLINIDKFTIIKPK